MDRRTFTLAAASFCLAGSKAAKAESGKEMRHFLPLSRKALFGIAADMRLPHERSPAGVPPEYDWARFPRMGAGNDPGNYTALTGWGQVFSIAGGQALHIHVQIRCLLMLACIGSARNWVLLQEGGIEGDQYRSDYSGNVSKKPPFFNQTDGIADIRFEAGTAYHFWPKQGRVDLPDKDIGGVLVLLQARTPAISASDLRTNKITSALVGLGADYWQSKTAIWDGRESNRDLAIGRLKTVGAAWQWYGMATASTADLRRLAAFGYSLL
jgi:hypothetical protein